jgi:hypothetical protein
VRRPKERNREKHFWFENGVVHFRVKIHSVLLWRVVVVVSFRLIFFFTLKRTFFFGLMAVATSSSLSIVHSDRNGYVEREKI